MKNYAYKIPMIKLDDYIFKGIKPNIYILNQEFILPLKLVKFFTDFNFVELLNKSKNDLKQKVFENTKFKSWLISLANINIYYDEHVYINGNIPFKVSDKEVLNKSFNVIYLSLEDTGFLFNVLNLLYSNFNFYIIPIMEIYEKYVKNNKEHTFHFNNMFVKSL